MGVEWNNDANVGLWGLVKSWKKAEAMYRSQIEEATKNGSPCEQMKGCATQLHECYHNLERALSQMESLRKAAR